MRLEATSSLPAIGAYTSARMLPAAIQHVRRAFVGPFAVYAPRENGFITLWRGFLADPWSPELDVVVATETGRGALASIDARRELGYVVGREPQYVARPAHRGVRLFDLLEKSEGAKPPTELVARVAHALASDELNIAEPRSLHEITVAFDGRVIVDGLDPDAEPRVWADVDSDTAETRAAILAACILGTTSYERGRSLVERVRGNRAPDSPLTRLIAGVLAGGAETRADAQLMPHDIGVVGALAQTLFPERMRAVGQLVEELAMIPPEARALWEQSPTSLLAPRPLSLKPWPPAAREETIRMLREAVAARDESIATVQRMRAICARAPRAPFWQRVRAFFGALVDRMRSRRTLPTAARLPPRRRRPRRRRGVNLR